MIFQFGQFTIDVDVDKTREFYTSAEHISEGCECPGCRNYEKAVDFLSAEIPTFFDSLGVDMKKAAEVWAIMANSDGSVYYTGFYHLCGKLLSCENNQVEKSTNEKRRGFSQWEASRNYSLTEDYNITFFDECGSLIEKDFPLPIFEIEVEANIPWVLNEENIYADKPKKQSFAAPTSIAPKPSVISRFKRWLSGFIT